MFWQCLVFSKFYVNDYIEDMATFTALVKLYSTYTKVDGLGEIFVKIFGCTVYDKYMYLTAIP